MTVPKSWHKVCQKTLSRANSCHIREKNGGIAMFAGRSDALMNYSEPELSEVLYDGLVGGALGLIGSGAELVQRGKGAETPDVDAGARQAASEGNFSHPRRKTPQRVHRARQKVRFRQIRISSPATFSRTLTMQGHTSLTLQRRISQLSLPMQRQDGKSAFHEKGSISSSAGISPMKNMQADSTSQN